MLLAFAAAAAVLLAWAAPGGTIDHIADFAAYLRRHDDRETKVIISLGAAVVVMLMATVVVVEMTPRPDQRMRVRNVTSGDAAITMTQIAACVDAAVAAIDHVGGCRATVTRRGKRVEILLELQVEAGADLARTADDACRTAQALVEQQLGIELAARPRARLHYRELRLGQDAAPPSGTSGWERPGEIRTAPLSEEERDERGQQTPTHMKRRKPRLIEPPPADQLANVLEAVLFVADAPIDVAALSRTVNASKHDVVAALDDLAESCRPRGVRVQRTGDLVQLVSAPQTAAYVERFLGLEHPPLTNPSLETLAIIAYRQPITRTGIESVRGVDCDGPIRTLVARGLVEEVGRSPVVGRPVLFGTTVRFLEYFGLEKPDDLPPLPFMEEPGQLPEEATI